jgi:hypothetical protein
MWENKEGEKEVKAEIDLLFIAHPKIKLAKKKWTYKVKVQRGWTETSWSPPVCARDFLILLYYSTYTYIVGRGIIISITW